MTETLHEEQQTDHSAFIIKNQPFRERGNNFHQNLAALLQNHKLRPDNRVVSDLLQQIKERYAPVAQNRK